MPSAKSGPLRQMSDADLAKELEEAHRRLFTLRMQAATGQLKDPHQIAGAKRQRARIKTVQRERQLARVVTTTAERRGGG